MKVYRGIIGAVLALGFLAANTPLACADELSVEDASCGSRAEIIRNLSGGFQEGVVAMGISSNGSSLIELLTSPDGAT